MTFWADFRAPKTTIQKNGRKSFQKVILHTQKLIPKKQPSKKIKMKRFATEFFGRLSGQFFGQKNVVQKKIEKETPFIQKLDQIVVQKIQ